MEVCREVPKEAAPYLVPSSTRMSPKQEVNQGGSSSGFPGSFHSYAANRLLTVFPCPGWEQCHTTLLLLKHLLGCQGWQPGGICAQPPLSKQLARPLESSEIPCNVCGAALGWQSDLGNCLCWSGTRSCGSGDLPMPSPDAGMSLLSTSQHLRVSAHHLLVTPVTHLSLWKLPSSCSAGMIEPTGSACSTPALQEPPLAQS